MRGQERKRRSQIWVPVSINSRISLKKTLSHLQP